MTAIGLDIQIKANKTSSMDVEVLGLDIVHVLYGINCERKYIVLVIGT